MERLHLLPSLYNMVLARVHRIHKDGGMECKIIKFSPYYPTFNCSTINIPRYVCTRYFSKRIGPMTFPSHYKNVKYRLRDIVGVEIIPEKTTETAQGTQILYVVSILPPICASALYEMVNTAWSCSTKTQLEQSCKQRAHILRKKLKYGPVGSTHINLACFYFLMMGVCKSPEEIVNAMGIKSTSLMHATDIQSIYARRQLFIKYAWELPNLIEIAQYTALFFDDSSIYETFYDKAIGHEDLHPHYKKMLKYETYSRSSIHDILSTHLN